MKIVSSFVASLVLAAVAGFMPVDAAKADCYGSPWGAVLVPAPNPIPLRRLRVMPAPVPVAGTCGPGCVNAVNAYAAPRPAVRAAAAARPSYMLRLASMRSGAAGLHRVLLRYGQLLLAQGLLVRFVRTAGLQLAPSMTVGATPRG